MTNIEKKIRQANLAANSWDFEVVKNAYSELQKWAKSFFPDEGNKKAIEATAFRLRFQALLITLLNGGFEAATYQRINDLLNALPEAAFAVTDEEFRKSVVDFEKARAFYEKMKSMLPEYYDWVVQARAISISEKSDLQKLQEISNVIDRFNATYTGGMLMQKVGETLKAMKEKVEISYEGAEEKRFGPFYASVSFTPDNFPTCKYFNSLLDSPGGSYKVTVVAAPNREEIDLIAVRFAQAREKKLVGVNFEALCKLPDSTVEYVLRRLERETRDQIMYVVGFDNADWTNPEILAMLGRLESCFETVENSILADGNPNFPVYEALEKMCGKLSRRMGYMYASMPDFDDFEQLLRESVGHWTHEDHVKLQRNGAYVGFIGLNEVMNNADDWERHIENLARRYRTMVLSFTGGMVSPEMLIDSGWKITETNRRVEVEDEDRNFDYDDISPLLQSNIQKIVDGPYTFMQKAGLLVRYSVTHGEDVGRWSTDFSDEEREGRLIDATMALAKWLQLPSPQVIIDPEDMEEWYAGLCCEGGKIVHYSYTCAHKNNVEFTMQVILHELYHAFQHKVRREAWQNWFENDLGVTVERKKFWNMNNENYIDLRKNKNAYKVQVVEVDAEVFAMGCLRMSSEVWSSVSFN